MNYVVFFFFGGAILAGLIAPFALLWALWVALTEAGRKKHG